MVEQLDLLKLLECLSESQVSELLEVANHCLSLRCDPVFTGGFLLRKNETENKCFLLAMVPKTFLPTCFLTSVVTSLHYYYYEPYKLLVTKTATTLRILF